MEQLQQANNPSKAVAPVSSMAPRTSNALEIATRQQNTSLTASGINALDLIPSEMVRASDFTVARRKLEANYGEKFSDERWNDLVEEIARDGWSSERFNRTLSWFIRNKRFMAWTIADWFDYDVKLYPPSWLNAECAKAGKNVADQMDVYLINGKRFFRYKDPSAPQLPFEKIG